MASHGIPRSTSAQQKSAGERQRELEKIQAYHELVRQVNAKRAAREYDTEALHKTSDLLQKNPEYYTIWNNRRLILRHQFSNAAMALATSESKNAQDEIKNLIQSDLQFLFPLLRQYPKCYWIWNHRLWDLEQATSFLPASLSRKFWQEELALVGTMLGLDCRNFHGWGYRREVIAVLETLATDHGDKDMAKSTPRGSMAQGEFDYTTKMIGTNLSNFSAWHNRTKLVLRLLDERQATDEERKNWLDDELKLIHRALCDPYDQSLWFYHQNLMCSFDPAVAPNTMAPNLGDNERVIYLRRELETLSDMLDGAEDCKWIYQALIHCTLLVSRIGGDLSVETRQNLSEWLTELKKLDPLRKGRWIDLEESLKL